MGRVLLVDGQPRGRSRVHDLLVEEGVEVVAAASATELTAELRRSEIDLVVLNLLSLGGRAEELVNAVKAAPPVSVLWLSAPEEVKQAIEWGGGFALGPVTLERLPSLVKRALAQARVLRERTMTQAMVSLLQIGQGLTEEGEPPRRVHLFLSGVCQEIQANQAGIHLWHEGDERPEGVASVGLPLVAVTAGSWLEPVARRAREEGKFILVADASEASGEVLRGTLEWNVGSFLCLPIFWKKRVVATVTLGRLRGQPPFNPDHIGLLLALAPFLTPVLVQLYEGPRLEQQQEQRRKEIAALNALLQRQQGKMMELESQSKGLEERYRSALALLSQAAGRIAGTAVDSAEVERLSLALSEAMGVPTPGLSEAVYLRDVGFLQLSQEGAMIATAEVALDHPLLGETAAREAGLPEEVAVAIRHHHEGYDGRGHPDGKAGEDIPLLSRIIAVAEGFVGLVSPSLGKEGMSRETALEEMRRGAGSLYDPAVLEMLARVLATEERRPEAEMVGTVSHELRSPLNFLVGYSELLASQPDLSLEARERAREIHAEAQHMSRMIERLMELSRFEVSRAEVKLKDVNLRELINRAVSKARGLSSAHQIAISVSEDLPTIQADGDMLLEVLDNLLGNAIAYSPQGGQVTVTALKLETGVQVSVADEGIGIPAHELPRIFEKFHRVPGPLKDKVRGTGLGLSICKHIVDAHGGRIWAESVLGTGSTFSFFLPQRPPQG